MALPFEVDLFCLFTLCIACYTDSTSRRIPNGLTLPMLCCGLVYGWLQMPGTEGIMFAGKGGITGGALLSYPYLKGWMGGGDLKLLAAIGSWIGPLAVLSMFLYGTVCGGIMAGAYLYRQCSSPKSKGPISQKTNIPYAWALGGGYLIYLFLGPVHP